jgi:hypothetical protein
MDESKCAAEHAWANPDVFHSDIEACIRHLDNGCCAEAVSVLASREPALVQVFADGHGEPWMPGLLRGVLAKFCLWSRHPRYGEQISLAWESLWPWASHCVDVEFWAQVGVQWAAQEPALTAEQAYPRAAAVTALHARASTAQELSAVIELASALARVSENNQIDDESFRAVQVEAVARVINAWATTGGEPVAAWVEGLYAFLVNETGRDAQRSLLGALNRVGTLNTWQQVPQPVQRRLVRIKLHLLISLGQRLLATKAFCAALAAPCDSDRDALEELGYLACNLIYELRKNKADRRLMQQFTVCVGRWLDWVGEDAQYEVDAEAARASFHDDANDPESAAEAWGAVVRGALIEDRVELAMKALNLQWLALVELIKANEGDSSCRQKRSDALITEAMSWCAGASVRHSGWRGVSIRMRMRMICADCCTGLSSRYRIAANTSANHGAASCLASGVNLKVPSLNSISTEPSRDKPVHYCLRRSTHVAVRIA